MTYAIPWFLTMGVLLGSASGCSSTNQERTSSSVQQQAFCGAPAVESVIDSTDGVAVLLYRARLVWEAERRAFSAYQALECGDCDASESIRSDFYASSAALINRIATEHPNDIRARCALGQMLFRKASLGGGAYDDAGLVSAESVLVAASELPDISGTLPHLQRLLADVREVLEINP